MANPQIHPVEGATDDTEIDQKIGYLLRWGMYLAAFVTAIGGVLFLVRHGGDPTAYGTFYVPDVHLRSPLLIVETAFHGSALGIMQLGMLLLIATPVARVVFSFAAFALRKDMLYVVISGIVLAVLAYSLVVH